MRLLSLVSESTWPFYLASLLGDSTWRVCFLANALGPSDLVSKHGEALNFFWTSKAKIIAYCLVLRCSEDPTGGDSVSARFRARSSARSKASTRADPQYAPNSINKLEHFGGFQKSLSLKLHTPVHDRMETNCCSGPGEEHQTFQMQNVTKINKKTIFKRARRLVGLVAR